MMSSMLCDGVNELISKNKKMEVYISIKDSKRETTKVKQIHNLSQIRKRTQNSSERNIKKDGKNK